MRETKFKNTEVGMIPEEWEARPISNSFSFICNNTLSRDQIGENGVVRNVHYGDILIKYGYILDVQRDGVPYINQSIRTIAKNPLRDGDILMADTAEDEIVGRCCEIRNICGEDVETGLHSFGLRPNHEYAPNFLGYAFNSSQYHDQLIPHIQGTKVSSVSKSAVSKTYLCCPTSFTEQRRIAQALSNVDSLILSLGKLIEKKKAIKQGAMQQLLTGKKRLKGFNEPWVERKLGDLGLLTGAGVDKLSNSDEEPVRLLNYLDVFHRDYIFNNELKMWVTANSSKKIQCNVIQGDVFFTPSSEMPYDIALSAVAMEDMPNVCYSYHIYRLRFSESIDLLYKAYMFKSVQFYNQANLICEGSGKRYVISLSKFREMTISYPSSIQEQVAISKILATMDNEIFAIEQKRAKYASIKQGMMQQLLTGKIRLI